MATADVGELKIRLTFDGKQVKAELADATSGLSKESKKAANDFKDVWKKAVDVSKGYLVGLGAAVAGLVTSSVKKFAEFEQLAGGMQKIFDEVDYNQIEKDANAAYKSMNISANEYMKNLSGVGATFAQTMGDQKGYNTAKQGMQALADYASGTGKSVDLLMDKYQAITRSASGYLSIADQFAGLLPQTTDGFLKQAQASGYLSGNYKKLTDVPVAEYQSALTQMLEDGVEKMGLLGNTADESEKTISGSFNSMKSAWENLQVAFARGENIDEPLDQVIDSAGNLVENVLPKVQEAVGNIFDKLWERAPVLTAIGSSLAVIAGAIVGINTAVKAAAAAQKAWNAVTKVGSAVQAAFKAVASANPVFLIAGAIIAVTAALIWFFTQTEEGQKILQSIGEFIGSIGEEIGELVGKIGEFFSGVWESISGFFTQVGEMFAGIAQWVWDHVLGPIVDFVKNVGIVIVAILATMLQWIWGTFLQPVVNFFVQAFETIKMGVVNFIEGVKAFFTPIVEWINTNIIQPIGNFFQGLWDGISNAVKTAADFIQAIWGGVVAWLQENVIQPIGNFFSGLWEGVKKGVEGMVEGIKSFMNTIGNIVKAPINGIIKAINKVIDTINGITVPDWVPGIGGQHANFAHVPELAKGGVTTGATHAIIGEAGTEAVLPLDRNTGWASILASTLADEMQEYGAERNIIINVNNPTVRNDNDITLITQGISQMMRRAA